MSDPPPLAFREERYTVEVPAAWIELTTESGIKIRVKAEVVKVFVAYDAEGNLSLNVESDPNVSVRSQILVTASHVPIPTGPAKKLKKDVH